LQRKPKTHTERVKERTALEQKFLSAVLADLGFRDLRDLAGQYPGVTWRHFRDKRHQALWRALLTLDLYQSPEEKLDKLIAEAGHDILDDRHAMEELVTKAEGVAWLERELAAAGALFLVGGKTYLRAVAAAWPSSLSADMLARQLWHV
jgi:hypothetical protein